ncbi:MAG: hypothetical protein WA738_05840 [Candidatus Angelobacter sp.]
MKTRIQDWMQGSDIVVKPYEQRIDELPNPSTTAEYNEKVVKPWEEESRMENEIRRKMAVPPTWANEAEKIEWHRRQLALLEKANQAPRCDHVYSDGTRCRAPRVRKNKVCYAHARMLAVRPRRLNLPPLEDANAVMLWLMEVSRALLEGEITERTAGLMFYGLQLAMATSRWTTFAQTKPEAMVRTAPEFTAKRAKGAKDVIRQSAEKRLQEQPETGLLVAARVDKATQPGAAVPHEAGERRKPEPEAAAPELSERKPVMAATGPQTASDERLLKGQRFASEPLDADTQRRSVSKLTTAGVEPAKSLIFGDELEGEGERLGERGIGSSGDRKPTVLSGATREP